MSKDFNDAHRILDALCWGSTIGEVHTKFIKAKSTSRGTLMGSTQGELGGGV